MPGQAPNSGDCRWLAPTTQAWPASSPRIDPVADGEGMRLGHGDPGAPAGAQLADVQPVEVVRWQALASGEDGDLEPPSSQGPQLRGRRGFHELNPQARVAGEQPGDGAWQQRCRCGGEPSDGQAWPAGHAVRPAPGRRPRRRRGPAACRTSTSPAAVSRTPRACRSNSGAPAAFSVTATCRDTADWVYRQPLGRRAERTGARHLQHHTQASQGQLGHPPSQATPRYAQNAWLASVTLACEIPPSGPGW